MPRHCSILFLLLALAGCGPAPAPPRPATVHVPPGGSIEIHPPAPLAADTGDVAPILVDSIHANNYLDRGLEPGNYNYHEIHGCSRALGFLKTQGFDYEEIREGRLDTAKLAGRKVLFLNLVSAERPSFLVSEIKAIREFVERGGGLFVVTDHSNAYFHANVLAPLFAELGLATHTDTICEVAPRTLGAGNGWISVQRFEPHPITAGLKTITLQAGGRVDRRHAIALTSEHAWADHWITGPYGHGDFPGYYGDWMHGPGEEEGPHGVVAAKQLGRGKIVVIGDQNMLGDIFLHYADNARLWLNAMSWLLDAPQLADAKYGAWRSPRIVLYDDYESAAFGASHQGGDHYAMVVLARHSWAFAGDRLDEPAELIVVAHDDLELPPAAAKAMAQHLLAGRNVLVLDSVPELFDENTMLKAIFSALPEAKRPQPTPGKDRTDFAIPGGGTLRLLHGPPRFDNYHLEDPTQTPLPEQTAAGELLLLEVRAFLPDGAAAPPARTP